MLISLLYAKHKRANQNRQRILWGQVIVHRGYIFAFGFFNRFLQNEGNKTDLNNFIATQAQTKQWNKQAYVTLGAVSLILLLGICVTCILYKDDNLTLEEADNRIVCHISHMIHGGI